VQAAATREPAGRVDLELLVRDELRAAAPRSGQVKIAGPPVQLQGKAAETIALALHELTTNAIKHGALAVAHGHISIHWRRDGDELVLDWKESGLALPPEPPARRGFGMELLERTLSYELDAVTRLRREASGITWTIRLPWNSRVMSD
jgi:two-component system CheB/CheR fusion protein